MPTSLFEIIKDYMRLKHKLGKDTDEQIKDVQNLFDDFVERRLKQKLNRYETRLGAVVVREIMEMFNGAIADEVTNIVEGP